MTSKIGVSAPSNIALVKYWGKKEVQRPINPSLSMTLSNCKTSMWVDFIPREKSLVSEVLLSGVSNEDFRTSLEKRLLRLKDELFWLENYTLKIESENTFPHSAGIASSASSMAALSFALCIQEQKELGEFSIQKASKIARLLSGSASRSLFPKFVSWGEESLDYASEVEEIHDSMLEMRDTILVVDSGVKKVSSSEGHRLIDNHPFKEARITQAQENFNKLKYSLRVGDFELFDEVTRSEALTLHALMMTSTPSYFLMRPESLKLIELIDDFKRQTKLPLTYTLDAGPNIHLIYPKEACKSITSFIETVVINELSSSEIIYDHMGTGPAQIE